MPGVGRGAAGDAPSARPLQMTLWTDREVGVAAVEVHGQGARAARRGGLVGRRRGYVHEQRVHE